MSNVLEVKHLKKVYKKKQETGSVALQDISFDMQEGEFLGIMGPSGSGKSTLLNLIATLDKPTSGEIIISGQNLEKFNEKKLASFRAERLGFIFQDYNLLENLTVYENIALPLLLQNKKTRALKRQVHNVAEILDIASLLNKYPGELSGGQRQRTAAARALIHEPALILGDEPTGALDSKNAKSLLQAFEKLNREERASILMVTHEAFSASYAHRILFIRDGLIYKELKRTGTQQAFYQEILQILAVLGVSESESEEV